MLADRQLQVGVSFSCALVKIVSVVDVVASLELSAKIRIFRVFVQQKVAVGNRFTPQLKLIAVEVPLKTSEENPKLLTSGLESFGQLLPSAGQATPPAMLGRCEDGPMCN